MDDDRKAVDFIKTIIEKMARHLVIEEAYREIVDEGSEPFSADFVLFFEELERGKDHAGAMKVLSEKTGDQYMKLAYGIMVRCYHPDSMSSFTMALEDLVEDIEKGTVRNAEDYVPFIAETGKAGYSTYDVDKSDIPSCIDTLVNDDDIENRILAVRKLEWIGTPAIGPFVKAMAGMEEADRISLLCALQTFSKLDLAKMNEAVRLPDAEFETEMTGLLESVLPISKLP